MTDTLKVLLYDRQTIHYEMDEEYGPDTTTPLMNLIVEKSIVYTPNGVVELYGYDCTELKYASNYYQCRIVFKLYDDIVNDQNICFGEIVYNRTDPDFLWKYGDFHDSDRYDPNDIENEKECLTEDFNMWFADLTSIVYMKDNFDIKIGTSLNGDPTIEMSYDQSRLISFDDLKRFIEIVEHLASEGRIICNLSLHE